MPQRRDLVLRSLDDMIRDVETLLTAGYDKVGKWDLGQVCGHIAKWLSYPIDGFPKPGCFLGSVLWLIRITVGKRIKKKILATGRFRDGGPTMPDSLVGAGADEVAAVAKLKETVERFKRHTGAIHPSPLFGKMNREELTRLHLIHCAHHLSFLIPTRN